MEKDQSITVKLEDIAHMDDTLKKLQEEAQEVGAKVVIQFADKIRIAIFPSEDKVENLIENQQDLDKYLKFKDNIKANHEQLAKVLTEIYKRII